MNFRNWRRRVRRLEREVKPQAPVPASRRCVGMTFQLYEGDPGLTWGRPEGEDGEPAEETADPRS